ncbi:MAG: DUF2357 domain-containing protein [Bacteroidota bacterium]
MADLLTIETPRVRVSWAGPGLRVEAGGRVRTFRGAARVQTAAGDTTADPDVTLGLAIPEEATLTLLVQSRDGDPVSVIHRDPSQMAGLVQADGGRVMHGRILVRDAAGWSRFTVQVGGRPEVEVVWPIRPTKLSPDAVAAMRAEVEDAWAGVALAAWGAATEAVVPAIQPSRPAWVALLREALARLEPALEAIARRPEVSLGRTLEMRPASRLRGDASSLATIRRGRGRGEWRGIAGARVREHVPIHVLRLGVEVEAHRWIFQRIERANRRLGTMVKEEREHAHAQRPRRRALHADLLSMSKRLEHAMRAEWLAGSAEARLVHRAPLVLRRRPAYRNAFDALRLLDAGLGVAEGEIEAAWLGAARLYETWVALAVAQEAARAVGAERPASVFGADTLGARVRVRRGRASVVRVSGPRGEIKVAYEPRFGRAPALLAQRPDLFLTLKRPGAAPRRAVLDAKYRRDESPGYLRRHGAAGPPEDALGDLHRYRDAIVDASGQRLVERAAALFPDAFALAFRESRLWTSHEAVGVGAIPLVPGDRDGLREWLENWVGG